MPDAIDKTSNTGATTTPSGGEATQTATPTAVAGATPSATGAEAVSTTGTTTGTQDQDRVLPMPTRSIKRIKDEHREKGRKEMQAELDKAAREAGFSSYAEALKVATAKQTPARTETPTETEAKPVQKQPAPTKSREDDAERQALSAEIEQLRKSGRRDSRKIRELEAALEAKEAEMALKESAWRAGIRDPDRVDFAIRLLEKELDRRFGGMKDEELAKASEAFDEQVFFKDLISKEPWLAGIEERRATTGTGAADRPASGTSAEEAAKQAARNGHFDAKSADAQTLAQRLAQLKIDPNSV
jgi:hypothetical protein